MFTGPPMKSAIRKRSIFGSLQDACQWSVVKRALIMAAVVGTILVGINHGMCLYQGHFNSVCLFQSALTFMVPYLVSTVSSVLAMSELERGRPV